MKTAISIPDPVFEEVDKLARETNTSRSRIFCLAVEEYLKTIKARRLRDALDAAYADEATAEEKRLRKESRDYFGKKLAKNRDDDKDADQTG